MHRLQLKPGVSKQGRGGEESCSIQSFAGFCGTLAETRVGGTVFLRITLRDRILPDKEIVMLGKPTPFAVNEWRLGGLDGHLLLPCERHECARRRDGDSFVGAGFP